jgi:hypothetical protein
MLRLPGLPLRYFVAYVAQECLNRGRMEFVRLEFAKDVMVQGRSIFLDRPTLGGSMKPFPIAFCKGITRVRLSGGYRWTVAVIWQRRLGENLRCAMNSAHVDGGSHCVNSGHNHTCGWFGGFKMGCDMAFLAL